MFTHICVGCHHLDRSAPFYDALLAPLGLRRRVVIADRGPGAVCWEGEAGGLPRFYVYRPFDRAPASAGNGSMVAFMAPSIAAVQAAHTGGLTAGGGDEGTPGPRSHYGSGYCGAYLRDPCQNKVHIVFRGGLLPAAGPQA